jgi:hypothetical protein
MRTAPTLAIAAALALPVHAQTVDFTESFSNGSNSGQWSWGTGGESFSPLNGNPGAFLQDLTLNTCCPSLGTQPGVSSVFTGDYRKAGVSSVGLDLVTLFTPFSVGARPLTVMLINDNGTPFGFDDDWGAYFIGSKTIPDSGVTSFSPPGWTDFEFAIDAQSEVTPPGWTIFSYAPGGQLKTWSQVVTQVTSLEFFYGDPTSIFIFHSWDVGTDNIRITMADCNGNGTPDFQDISSGAALDLDGNFVPDGCQPLSADVASISVGTGGAQTLQLQAGAASSGDLHLVLGSISGTSPGVPFGGGTLPLNIDGYFMYTLGNVNSPPLSNSFGFLDGTGSATTQFALGAGSPSSLAGLEIFHAFITLDAVTFAANLASNTIPVQITL